MAEHIFSIRPEVVETTFVVSRSSDIQKKHFVPSRTQKNDQERRSFSVESDKTHFSVIFK